MFCYCPQPPNFSCSRLQLGAFGGEKLVGEKEVGRGDGGIEISVPPSFSPPFLSQISSLLPTHSHICFGSKQLLQEMLQRGFVSWGGTSSQTPSQGHLWPLHSLATSAMDDLGVMKPTSLPHTESFPTPGHSTLLQGKAPAPFQNKAWNQESDAGFSSLHSHLRRGRREQSWGGQR